jgi:hypothetical protein
MANSYSGKATLQILSDHLLDGDLADTHDKLNNLKLVEKTIGNGTGAGNAQVHWHDQFTLAAASDTVTLDLAALTRNIGGTVTFTKIKYFVLKLVTATTGFRATLQSGDTNGFDKFFASTTDIVNIPADGIFHVEAWTDGMVVDGTHKTIKITHAAGGALQTYHCVIIGEGSVA